MPTARLRKKSSGKWAGDRNKPMAALVQGALLNLWSEGLGDDVAE